MTAIVEGIESFSSTTVDKDGFRDYKIRWRISALASDSPTEVMFAAGLPLVGTSWTTTMVAYSKNGVDDWAFCWPNLTITPLGSDDGEKHEWYLAEQLFTNRPFRRCQDTRIDDPLDEPQRISGSFVKYTKRALKDRNGKAILSYSHEQIKGLEKDANRPSVVIEQNVLSLGLSTFSQMIDTLNDAPLWGLPARCIKLSNAPWERKLYGVCTYYYTRRFEFDVIYEGFDLTDVVSQGFKVLDEGIPDADKNNPAHFKVYKDRNDENTPVPIMIGSDGKINEDPVNYPSYLPAVELYGESNFLTLGIPTTL